MKIALIGYGKMGKAIEQVATERGHEIALTIDLNNTQDLSPDKLGAADVAIEFTTPETAVSNISKCFDADVPVVVGTTGWLDKLEEVSTACKEQDRALFHASNFSIGVNILFRINKQLASLMNSHNEYDVHMEEIHHIHKADAPSGTAITLAEGILDNLGRKKDWVLAPSTENDRLQIASIRTNEVPGTHTVVWHSDIDSLEIRHTAKGRKGFALGAVIAAEWLAGKKGIFGMDDLLKG